MDKFQIDEQEGRGLLCSFLQKYAKKIDFTQDKYCPVDVFFTFQDNRKAVGEIKVRAKKYQGYYTHLIELRKLMALEDACSQQHLDYGFYFIFFGNDTLYIYNIRDIRRYGYHSSGTYNQTTAVASEKVLKQMVEIPTRYATKFILKEDKWYKEK